jgi:quercetin dioxygenase-like cupin family protein
MCSRLWLVTLLCLTATALVSEEASKADPKHYKLAFANNDVQVVYIHYGPHEKSPMHDHPRGMVVYISDGHLRFTDQVGNVQEVSAKRGESRWFPAFKHQVENLGDSSFDGVYIGMKH